MKPHTVEKIGPKQSITREGFLLCEDVPLARTGKMIYGPGETPVQVGGAGYVTIIREEDEVFHPESMASFVGKDVVDEHPDDDVMPENYRFLTRGKGINQITTVGLNIAKLL